MTAIGSPVPVLAEIVGRVVLVYLFLLALVRVAGKREVGQLSPMEFLSVLLLSESVGPALTAGERSLAGALVAAATVMGLTMLINLAAFRSRRLERLSEGRPELLIRSGRINHRVMKKERITVAQLKAALRRNGVESAEEVEKAYVETNGEITVLRGTGTADAERGTQPPRQHPPEAESGVRLRSLLGRHGLRSNDH